MTDQKISVVMACYHGDRIAPLKEAVDSVLGQTISFYEFIIVVDGPVNKEIDKYLEELSVSRNDISLIRLEKNSGAARARNIGMSAAKGDYLAIMDSDDILMLDRLEVQLSTLVEKNVDAVWGWQEEFYDETYEFAGIKKCPEDHDDILKKLKYRCLLPDPTTFIKKECFVKTGGYAEFDNINIDYKFFLKIALNGYRLFCVQRPLIRVRISPRQRQRRGGLVLLREDFLLRHWMYKKKIINLFELFWLMLLYAAFRLQPNILRDKVYKHVLRTP